jgi:hypothetical protein
MKRVVLVVLPFVAFVACRDERSPTAVRGPAISAEIRDAVNGGGNPHFFWLPPIVAAPNPTGVFNPRLSPVVEICSQNVSPCPDGQVHATFTMTSGTGSQIVRVDVTNQLYVVNWNTDPSSEPVGSSFRIAVIVHKAVLGFADVDIVGTGKAKNANTGGDVLLVNGRTLPIKFRIEDGALCPSNSTLDCAEHMASPGTDNTIVSNNQQAGTFIPAGALSQPVTVTIVQNSTKRCIPAPFALPEFENCYDFFTDPGPNQFNVPVTVAMCIDLESVPSTAVHQLQVFQFDVGLPVRALPNVPATFLPCNGGSSVGSRASGVTGFLARLWRALTPRPLFASHLGVGGSSGSFSTFTWSFVPEIVTNSINPQLGAVGTPVLSAPTVLLRDTTAAHNPVAGVTVTFTVEGGGTIVQNSVVTGSDGLASVGSWTLGAVPGVNRVIATAAGAISSPDTFTAVGAVPVVGLCPAGAVGTLATFTSFGDALAAVPPGGKIELCSGTFTADNVEVTKPVTIEAAPDAATPPVIQTSIDGGIGFAIDAVASGTVAFRRLSFTSSANGVTSIAAFTTYDQVAVDNATFTLDPNASGVFAGLSTVGGAKVVVTNSSFTGGQSGVFASGNLDESGQPILATAPHLDVLNSTFHDFTFSGIQYQVGASGRISGNTVTACGFAGCIRSRSDNQIEISGNAVTVDAGRITFNRHIGWGIAADGVVGSSHLIVGNAITGVGGGGDPSNPASYAIQFAGIGLGRIRVDPFNTLPQFGNAMVSGNTIVNADTGLSAHDALITGTDNVITGTLVAIAGVSVTTTTSLSLNRSDVTSYVVPMAGDGLVDLTCNWWGTDAGPQNVPLGLATGVFTPFATVPIANNTGVTCGSGAIGAPTINRSLTAPLPQQLVPGTTGATAATFKRPVMF